MSALTSMQRFMACLAQNRNIFRRLVANGTIVSMVNHKTPLPCQLALLTFATMRLEGHMAKLFPFSQHLQIPKLLRHN